MHIAGVVRAFEALGHKVSLSSPSGVDPRCTAGSDPFSAGGKQGVWGRIARYSPRLVFECLELGYNAAAWLRNRRMLARRSCDLIYERHAFFLCSTGLLARSREIPLVVEVNELVGDPRVRKQPLLASLARCADRALFRRARLIVVVSPYLKRRIEEMGIPGDRVLVQPNAVAEEDVAEARDGGAIRQAYGFGDEVVVGFVGWLVH